MPATTLNASVTTTATATVGAMAPMSLGAIVRPNQKKKIAANVSRSGTSSRSTRGPIPVPATTMPARSAPTASEAPALSAKPATKTPKPTMRMTVSSASPVEMTGRTRRAPHLRQGEQADQERERDRDRQDDLARALLLTEDRLQEREVEREEDVLDDDDPEDHPGLGIGDPAKVEDELRDDRRRRRPDHPGDDEDLARPPAERPAEHEAGAEVERDVRAARPQQTPPTAEEIVDRELDPEVKEQQDQAEHRQQVDRLRVLEHDDSRRMRAEDDSRDDEERDRRKAEAPADASEQPGEQERRSENGELVLHQKA